MWNHSVQIYQTADDPRPPILKRLQYDRTNLQRAYDATLEGMSVCKAAKLYNVPESTLRDRTRGNVAIDARNGTGTLLSESEEKELVAHIKHMSEIGYGYTKSDVQYMARDFAMSLKKPVKCKKSMSNSWFYDFIKRWPELKVAKPQKLSMSRAKSTSQESLANYYSELHSIMLTNDLLDHPEHIFNIDETGVSTEHTPSKIVCGKTSVAQSVTSPRSSNITIIASGNALGNHIPPYYVFPGKRWSNEFLSGAATGSDGEMSKNGWSNSDVFNNYLTKHFSKYAGLSSHEGGHKTLVLYDGHKSHVLLTLTEWAKKHNVILFVLPPHSSHLTQPLDVGVFGPFKRMLHSECQTYMRQNPGISVTKNEIAQLTSKPYTKALCPDNLTAAFRKVGIYPFNNTAITPEQVAPATIYSNDKADSSHCDQSVTDTILSTTPVAATTEISKSQDFFEKRTIKTALQKPKRKFIPPFIAGSLMNKHNQDILEVSATKKSKFQTECNNRKYSDPKPGTSGINTTNTTTDIIPQGSESSAEETDLCCMCNDWQPNEFRLCQTVNFVTWGKCDFCTHWTHLKFCSEVKVLRRASTFRCPHCLVEE